MDDSQQGPTDPRVLCHAQNSQLCGPTENWSDIERDVMELSFGSPAPMSLPGMYMLEEHDSMRESNDLGYTHELPPRSMLHGLREYFGCCARPSRGVGRPLQLP